MAERQTVTVDGIDVRISPHPDRPLILLVRMAAGGMGIWDGIWDRLAELFTVAQFDLPTPDLDRLDDPVAIFRHYSDMTVRIAEALGHRKFHIFGWTGGTHVAIRCAIEHPDRLHSCTLLGPISTLPDNRAVQVGLDMQRMLLDAGLREYTYSWIMSGLSWDYILSKFDRIESIVDRRMQADQGRMDTENVFKWIKALRHPTYTDDELAGIRVPTLIVAPGFDRWPSLHMAERLADRIPTAELAVAHGGGALMLMEAPEKFMVAAGRFLRAAACGRPIAHCFADRDALTVLSGGRRLAMVEPRPERAIVFLHGWLMSPDIWRHSIDALSSRHRCIAPWQPAHGPSGAPPTDFTMADWSDWLADSLRAVGVGRAVLVGHSMGGFLAQETWRRHPELVAGLVLVGTQDTCWPDTRNEEFRARVDNIAYNWNQDLAATVAARLVGERLVATQPAWVGTWTKQVAGYDLQAMSRLAVAIAGRDDFSASSPDITVPVSVIHGSADQAVDPADGRAMADRIPNATFVTIDGAGHAPSLEDPEAFTAALSGYLDTWAPLS